MADAYYRRNEQARSALTSAGFKAKHDDLAGGFVGVRVPLEGGYHVHMSQDMDNPQHPWAAQVSHGEHQEPVHEDGNYDVPIGHAHPSKLPEILKQHLGPRGAITAQIQEHAAKNRNLGRQF